MPHGRVETVTDTVIKEDFVKPRAALWIVNRKARHGRHGLEALRRTLTDGGVELIDALVEQAGDLSDVIRKHHQRVDLVIIGGGDGTIHHALDGLLETQLPLGILPLGTANDLARTLQLPTDPLAACKIILRGHTAAIDLGKVNDRLFCNVASIGLAVQVTQRLKRETKSRWGVLAYVIAALQSLMYSRPFPIEIDGDAGRHAARSIQVTIGNGRSYGGGLTVNESATVDDGILHLFSLEIARWWHIVPLIPAMWRGTLDTASNVRTLRGSRLELRTPCKPQPLIADGEFAGATPAHLRLIPKAIRVFVPRRSVPD